MPVSTLRARPSRLRHIAALLLHPLFGLLEARFSSCTFAYLMAKGPFGPRQRIWLRERSLPKQAFISVAAGLLQTTLQAGFACSVPVAVAGRLSTPVAVLAASAALTLALASTTLQRSADSLPEHPGDAASLGFRASASFTFTTASACCFASGGRGGSRHNAEEAGELAFGEGSCSWRGPGWLDAGAPMSCHIRSCCARSKLRHLLGPRRAQLEDWCGRPPHHPHGNPGSNLIEFEQGCGHGTGSSLANMASYIDVCDDLKAAGVSGRDWR